MNWCKLESANRETVNTSTARSPGMFPAAAGVAAFVAAPQLGPRDGNEHVFATERQLRPAILRRARF